MSSWTRRSFILASAAPALLRGAAITSRQRIDAALQDQQADRPPFTLWHHFGLEKQGGEAHAKAILQFHRDYRTDLVKVMSDFPYPKPAGAWYELKPVEILFPEQLKALDLIREGLKQDGKNAAYFVETLFNPWNVAEKLSSPAEVQRLRQEQPPLPQRPGGDADRQQAGAHILGQQAGDIGARADPGDRLRAAERGHDKIADAQILDRHLPPRRGDPGAAQETGNGGVELDIGSWRRCRRSSR